MQLVLGKTESDNKSLAGLRMFAAARAGESHPEAGDISYRPIFQDLGVLAEPDYPSARESFVLTSLVQLETPLCVRFCEQHLSPISTFGGVSFRSKLLKRCPFQRSPGLRPVAVSLADLAMISDATAPL